MRTNNTILLDALLKNVAATIKYNEYEGNQTVDFEFENDNIDDDTYLIIKGNCYLEFDRPEPEVGYNGSITTNLYSFEMELMKGEEKLITTSEDDMFVDMNLEFDLQAI